MKLATIFTIGFLSLSAFAQNTLPQAETDSEMKVIYERIDHIKQNVSEMVNNIHVHIQEQEVKFPEYTQVLGDFYTRTSDASTSFEKSMDGIRTRIESTLSKEYSELNAVQKLYDKQGGKGLKNLLNEKERRVVEAKAKLEVQINSDYSKAIKNIVSAGGLLVIPATRRINPYIAATVGAGMAVATPIMMFVPGGLIAGPIVGALASATVSSNWSDSDAGFDGMFDDLLFAEDNFGETYEDLLTMRRALKEAGANIFPQCKTAGCVYLISEYYKAWLKAVTRINKNVKLVDGLKFNKIHVAGVRKMKKRLDQLSKIAAEKLPIGLFSDSEQK